jgi:hypothetical protein
MVPAAQILQERSWMLHYALFLLSESEDNAEFLLKLLMKKEFPLCCMYDA